MSEPAREHFVHYCPSCGDPERACPSNVVANALESLRAAVYRQVLLGGLSPECAEQFINIIDATNPTETT